MFLKHMLNQKLKEPIKQTLKIIAISDTHGDLTQLENLISQKVQGDIFIHCGDFTRYGRQSTFQSFLNILSSLQFSHKIIISGNHQICLDSQIPIKVKTKFMDKYPCKFTREYILERFKFEKCIYLEHQQVEIEGIKIFGSPYTIKYGNSAFQRKKQDLENVFSTIPHDIDLLITHGPPLGILDKTSKGNNAGSEELLKKVMKIKPKFHIFGHIHEGKGSIKINGIHFMNVAKQAAKINFPL